VDFGEPEFWESSQFLIPNRINPIFRIKKMEAKRVRTETKYIVGPSNPDSRVFWDHKVTIGKVTYRDFFDYLGGGERDWFKHPNPEPLNDILAYNTWLTHVLFAHGSESIKSKLRELRGKTFQLQGLPSYCSDLYLLSSIALN